MIPQSVQAKIIDHECDPREAGDAHLISFILVNLALEGLSYICIQHSPFEWYPVIYALFMERITFWILSVHNCITISGDRSRRGGEGVKIKES